MVRVYILSLALFGSVKMVLMSSRKLSDVIRDIRYVGLWRLMIGGERWRSGRWGGGSGGSVVTVGGRGGESGGGGRVEGGGGEEGERTSVSSGKDWRRSNPEECV